MAVKFYDPDREVLYLAGIRIQGWADGEFCTYEWMAPGFMPPIVGTDGEVARSRSANRVVKFTFKLLQTSATNAAFTTLHATDLAAPNGAGVGTLLLQDLNGFTRISSSQAWIEGFPAGSLDRTAKPREWTVWANCDAPGAYAEGGN